MKFRIFTKFSVLLVILSIFAMSQVLKVVTFPIPVMVESADKGVFIELVKSVAKKAGLKVEITVLPTKRAIGSFLSGEPDMLFPALDIQFHGQTQPTKSSEIIYVKQDFGFVKKGNNAPLTISDLKGKKIGITAGYPYSEKIVFDKSLTLEEAESDEVNVKKLVNGRIDVFIVEEKSGLGAINKTAPEKTSYTKESPLSKQDVYFAFQKNSNGKKFETKFSTALKEMKKDGSFGAIMSKAK